MVVMSLLESTAFLMPGPQEVLSKLSDIPLWVGVMGESDGNRDGKEWKISVLGGKQKKYLSSRDIFKLECFRYH